MAFVLRRLSVAIPTIFVIITLTFFLMQLTPGGPFSFERPVTPQVLANLENKYPCYKPIHPEVPLGERLMRIGGQYLCYIGQVLQGDLGPSFKNQDFTVTELIVAGLPKSAVLGFSAITIALFVGVGLGLLAALRQNSAADYTTMGIALFGITVPTFVTAPLLLITFGTWLGWLPLGTWGDGEIDHLILPVTALALPQIAIISRLTRGSMIEVLRSNFIRTAKAKGLPVSRILWRHAVPAGLVPVITYLGPATAGLLTGSVVIERVFQLPGIGDYFVTGAQNRDYTLVMGVVIVYSVLIVFMNFLADLLLAALDPRARQI